MSTLVTITLEEPRPKTNVTLTGNAVEELCSSTFYINSNEKENAVFGIDTTVLY